MTLSEQVDHLLGKGLSLGNGGLPAIEGALRSWGYYRLRGYWLTLEKGGRFLPGTSVDDILEIMELDCALSALVSSLVTPVELQLRASICNSLATRYGACALHRRDVFRDQKLFLALQSILEREREQARRNKKPLVLHNLSKYGQLPIWAEVEIASMGTLSKVYGALSSREASVEISSCYRMRPAQFAGWLRYLTQLRNMVAHHDRLYNRMFAVRPKLFAEHRDVDNARLFPAFIVLLKLLDELNPSQAQRHRVELGRIIAAHSGVNLGPAGFPEQWREILGVPSSAPRTRGCSGGRKPKDPNALAKALLMYNSREYTISQITEETHISTSTLYKYIHLQES